MVNMDIQSSGRHDVIGAHDPVGQFITRKDSPRTGNQEFQQLKLRGSQADDRSAQSHLITGQVDDQGAKLQQMGRRRGCPAGGERRRIALIRPTSSLGLNGLTT